MSLTGIIATWPIVAMLLMATTAAPIGNNASTEDSYQTSWVTEPKGRGTLSILHTCISTLFLCVWNAIHPNIRINTSTIRRGLNKIQLVIIGMFFPESMLLAALIDHREARRFRSEWQKRNETSSESSKHIFDMEGSYFVHMGGYSVGKVEDYSQFANILTPNGLLFLSENGLVAPEVLRKKSIADKNKADLFVKVWVFLQIIWMATQCLLRALRHIPITTLESHVVLHVIYTIFTYGIWWDKPLDILDPIPVINDPELASLIVVLLAPHSFGKLSTLSIVISDIPYTGVSESEIADGTGELGVETEFIYTFIRGNTSTCTRKRGTVDKIYFLTGNGSVPKTAKGSPGRTVLSPLGRNEGERPPTTLGKYRVAGLSMITNCLIKMGIIKKGPNDSERPPQPVEHKVRPTQYIVLGGQLKLSLDTTTDNNSKSDNILLQRTDIINLHSGARAVATDKYSKIVGAIEKYNETAYDEKMPLLVSKPRTHNIYNKRTSNDTSRGQRRNKYIRGLTTIVFVIFPASYSGWHAMYWNRHFPTPTESYLWKLSSILVGTVPLIYELICIIDGDISRIKVFLEWLELSVNRLLSNVLTPGGNNVATGRKVVNILRGVGNSLLFALFILFLFGRLFLVVEAFISMRSIPHDSFKTPF
ncbi:hypothetical protein DFP73DRAFT_613638 [Morchella snyderi]|nr:hypothetical protein DFP73DRAFT_613638 [Morchella snyderi]